MEDTREKLEVEVRNLDKFKEILSRSNQQTKVMVGILSHFDERLSKLEETIQPVYRETGNLQGLQENIMKTLENLDFVIKFYTVASEVEPIVRSGPTSGSLGFYLENLDRLQGAIRYFEENNPESPELMNVSALLDKGGNNVEKEFRNLLSRHSNPVPPILIYDLVHEEDASPEADKMVLEQLPEKARNELRTLAEWLCENKSDDFVAVYANLRSEVVVKSLQGLRDHQRSCSGGLNVSGGIQGSHSSPVPTRKAPIRDTPPGRRTPKSIQQALRRKLQDVIPGEMLGSKFSHQVVTEAKDDPAISEREIVSYLTCVTALYKLMQSELKLMEGIIPLQYQKMIFSRLIQPSLENVVGEGETLANRVKRCVARHDFNSALSLFPILRHQASMRHNFDLLFDGCSPEVQSKFQGLVVTLQTTINRALEEFIDYIKTDADTKVPKDGTVHELTSNVMIFIVQLLNYMDILSRVIAVTDLHCLEIKADKNRLSFAQYITRVLSALGLTLQNKSETYTDPYLRAIFKLNNLHYILKTLKKSTLLDVVQLYNNEMELVYVEQVLENKRIYSQSWSRVLHFVLEMDKPVSQQRTMAEMSQMASMKLKDKERQNIKDKFAGFNKEIEEIRKAQTAYALPDPDLREDMKRDNRDFIVPKYKMFYDKFVSMNFTKNLDKYVRYTPEDVAQIIDTFFDSAA